MGPPVGGDGQREGRREGGKEGRREGGKEGRKKLQKYENT